MEMKSDVLVGLWLSDASSLCKELLQQGPDSQVDKGNMRLQPFLGRFECMIEGDAYAPSTGQIKETMQPSRKSM